MAADGRVVFAGGRDTGVAASGSAAIRVPQPTLVASSSSKVSVSAFFNGERAGNNVGSDTLTPDLSLTRESPVAPWKTVSVPGNGGLWIEMAQAKRQSKVTVPGVGEHGALRPRSELDSSADTSIPESFTHHRKTSSGGLDTHTVD